MGTFALTSHSERSEESLLLPRGILSIYNARMDRKSGILCLNRVGLREGDSMTATSRFLAFVAVSGCMSISLAVQAAPGSAQSSPSVDSGQEVERLHTILNVFTSHPCQNIAAAAVIAETDVKTAQQILQAPLVQQYLSLGVTLDEYLRVALSVHCLTHEQKQYKIPPFRWAIQKTGVINAYANSQQRIVTVTTGIIDFTRDDPGELVFAMAHELGHLVDQPLGCAVAMQREHWATLTLQGGQRWCEARADNIGMQYLIGAGLGPYEAAAFFGRLQMWEGQKGFLDQLVSDHPIDANRIENLRSLIIRIMQKESGMPSVR